MFNMFIKITQNSMPHAHIIIILGVRGGPLFETTRAWFNFLRILVSIMKRGYEEPQEIIEDDG